MDLLLTLIILLNFTSDCEIRGDDGGEGGGRGDMVITNGIEAGSPVVSLVFEGDMVITNGIEAGRPVVSLVFEGRIEY